MAQLAAGDQRHPVALPARPWRRPALTGRALLWAPFWLGSEIPLVPPMPPAPATGALGPAGEQIRHDLDAIGRRLAWRNLLHLIARAIWLTLAVGCLSQLVALAGGPAVTWPALSGLGGGLLVLAVTFALRNRPHRAQTARMLDRTFRLDDRLVTALDHLGHGLPAPGQRAPLTYLQIADAANITADLRHHPALGIRAPVREIMPALGFALLLAALTFLQGTGDGIPPVVPASVPKFTPAVAREAAPDQIALSPENTELAPSVDEVMARAADSQAAEADLNRLAEALADHAITRPAADALREANYGGAGDELRAAATTADQLSPAAREALARDLAAAATGMAPANQDLSEAATNAAAGLREGGEPARTELSELGDAVAQAGERVATPEELANQMQRAQEGERRQQQQQGRPQGGSDSQSRDAGEQAAAPAPQPGDAAGAPSGQPPGEDQAGGPDEGQSSQAPGEGADPGEGEQGGPSNRPGEGGNPSESETAGAGGAPAPPGETDGTGIDARNPEGMDASQGPGAAGGESEADAPGSRGNAAAGPDRAAQPGAAEENVTEGVGERASAPVPAGGNRTSLELGSEPGGDGIQTVNNAGGTVRGSGAGITAGGGTATQGEVGAAGPDSNNVPPEYRSVVERYFSNQDDR